MAVEIRTMTRSSEQPPARRDLEKVEKIKLIAYQLWLARRETDIAGDAERDYYHAERILEYRKNLKRSLLGSFGFSAIAFVLGGSADEHYVNAVNAVLGLNDLVDEPSDPVSHG
jgi:hypothetical protein